MSKNKLTYSLEKYNMIFKSNLEISNILFKRILF